VSISGSPLSLSEAKGREYREPRVIYGDAIGFGESLGVGTADTEKLARCYFRQNAGALSTTPPVGRCNLSETL
jgi:hypothetical protein